MVRTSEIKSETLDLKYLSINQSIKSIPSRTPNILYVHPALVTPGGMLTLAVMHY